jgi:hypothetical protein
LEGERIDSELGDMRGSGLRGSSKLFSYVRYDTELSREGLDGLGLPNVKPAHVQPMDAIEFLGEIQQVGVALAERKVKPEHFAHFVPAELGSQTEDSTANGRE